jgi:hypothetical protein
MLAGIVVGLLGNTTRAMEVFTAKRSTKKRPARNFSASGHPYPHNSDREKLRRRIGGFAKLHDHTIRYVGEPYLCAERCCPICDQGQSHDVVAKAKAA